MTQPQELVLTGGRILDVERRRIVQADVRIRAGRIAAIEPPGTTPESGAAIIDVSGKYISPGFIDSHLHIESSMLSPLEFAKQAALRGTTGVFVDPHEIANVAGQSGLDLFLDQSRRVPIDLFIGIPSCVPATPLEEAGAVITLEVIQRYISDSHVYGLAEMMNFPGIIHGDEQARAKVQYVYDYGKIVDGHCPGLTGEDLRTYISNGHGDGTVRIMSDHESTTVEEVREKYEAGMWPMLRYGSASKDLDAILPALIESGHPLDRILLCSDDLDPGELAESGHVDRIIRRAREIIRAHSRDSMETATLKALALATSHPGRYFHRFFRHHNHPEPGRIAEGAAANLVVLDSLESLQVDHVVCRGELVARDGQPTRGDSEYDYSAFTGSVHPGRSITADDFTLHVPTENRARPVRVIWAIPGSLVTETLEVRVNGADGEIPSDPTEDIAKIAVFERHKGTGAFSVGLVKGLGLQTGAIASTVAHDSHNLIVAGIEAPAMARAANLLVETGGGLAVVAGEQEEVLPLPIAGLMSMEDLPTVVEQYHRLMTGAQRTGSRLETLFMTLSFLALPVIPELKITSNGLVDVGRFDFVSFFTDPASS